MQRSASAAVSVIEALDLRPHPEGGYYRETYRTDRIIPASVLSPDYPSARHVCTAIYYLLTAEDISRWHRVSSDEMWHFYAGDAFELACLSPDGKLECAELGNGIAAGMCPQIVIPANSWQSARLKPGGEWGLVGCTVAPGFDFADFEMANIVSLCEQYPQHAAAIRGFGRMSVLKR